VLIDGFFCDTFKITRQHNQATLLVTPFTQLSRKGTADLTTEGAKLLAFAATDAEAHDIQFAPAE
jgi:hypothetical protein